MDKAQSKILRGTEGIGNVTPEMVDERAREIARTDGRDQANDLDRIRAREDLIGGSEQSGTVGEPESDWYTPRGASGKRVPKVGPDDEENIPQKLVQEGIDEADHDQRRAPGLKK